MSHRNEWNAARTWQARSPGWHAQGVWFWRR
jgi:hypothetical protein